MKSNNMKSNDMRSNDVKSNDVRSNNIKRVAKLLYWGIVSVWILACNREEKGINVEEALRYQVEKEAGGKLDLVSFEEISAKQDYRQDTQIYALTYRATILSKEDLRWGTSKDNKLSRFIPYAAEHNFAYQNRESTKAGEIKELTYTIVFQKKDGQWIDQFGKIY